MPVPSRLHAEALATLAPLYDYLVAHDDALLRAQVALAQTPAPTGDEGDRAAWMRDRFTALGLAGVRIDDAGNVIGRRPGRLPDRPVVVCAHLDTVFSRDTPHVVTRDRDRYVGPSITDNSRGLAAMLAVAESMNAYGAQLEHPVEFVGSTGEEGNGDLRGVKHYFARASDRPSAMIALDGAGDERIIHRALGARRYRVSFAGPGGHSWSAFGAPNAIHAAAGATARLASIQLSAEPRTTLSVGRIGGGISVNAIPNHAWLEVDVRSTASRALDRMDVEVHRAVAAAVDDENARRARDTRALTAHVAHIGDRPGGETPAEHPLVEAAREITFVIGREPELAIASTDANVAIGLGIPAIAIGAGGQGGDAHSATEWFENVDGPRGVWRALAIVLSAAGAPAT